MTEYAREIEGEDLLGYWHVLSRFRNTLILMALLGLLAGIVITLPQTPVYRARASLEIQEVNHDFMNMKQLSPVAEASSDAALSDIQTQVQILQSETVIERTLRRLNIQSPEGLNPRNRITEWRRRLDLPAPAVVHSRERLLRAAGEALRVSLTGDARIVEILFDSSDPQVASEFVNTLVAEFIEENMQARWETAQRTSKWLAGQLGDAAQPRAVGRFAPGVRS